MKTSDSENMISYGDLLMVDYRTVKCVGETGAKSATFHKKQISKKTIILFCEIFIPCKVQIVPVLLTPRNNILREK